MRIPPLPFFQEESLMTTAVFPSSAESLPLTDRIVLLESAIGRLQNRKIARGALKPDDATLLDQCLRELATLKRQRGD